MATRKRIAVIGAGAAGLASLRELRLEGHDAVAFERTQVPGGHWNTDYDALHLITPRSVSAFRDHPQPATYPNYASREQVVRYLHDFARSQGLLQHIRFGVEVTNVVPRAGIGLGGWELELNGGEIEYYDAVVVANGHLHEAYVPHLPGEFAGKLLHSGDYRNVGDIEGDRVLVVGAGNSGCDLAVDAAQARREVSISVRHGFIFMPKSLFGMPRLELPISKLPPRLYARILRLLIRVSVGRPEQYGLPEPPSRDFTKQRAIVNDLLPYWITHGRIRVRPGIQSVDGYQVTFSDGTASTFDTILLATGFRYSAPFLSLDVLRRENDMPRRWASGILPHGLANLYFVGLIAPMGAQWPIYEMQSQQVCQMLRVQSDLSEPLVKHFQRKDAGFSRLELQRRDFLKLYGKTQRDLEALERCVARH